MNEQLLEIEAAVDSATHEVGALVWTETGWEWMSDIAFAILPARRLG